MLAPFFVVRETLRLPKKQSGLTVPASPAAVVASAAARGDGHRAGIGLVRLAAPPPCELPL